MSLTWTPSRGPPDLAGWAAKAQIRLAYDRPVLAEMSTDNGGITLGPAGSIDLLMPASATKLLDFKKGEWDLVLKTPLGEIQPPLLEGDVYLIHPITLWQ